MRKMLKNTKFWMPMLGVVFASAIIALIMIYNSVANAKQFQTFEVKESFCYSGDCFNIEKSDKIQIYNNSVTNGKRNVTEYSSAKINDQPVKNMETGYIYDVRGDVITFETGYFKLTYSQKRKMFLTLLDKNNRLTEEDIPQIKSSINQIVDALPVEISKSGEIIPIKFEITLPTVSAKMDVNAYVHGFVPYKNITVPLIEIRGIGTVTNKGKTTHIQIAGYELKDVDTNIIIRKVIDTSVTDDSGFTKIHLVVQNEIN